MNKELKAFNRIMETYGKTNSLEGTYDDFLTIKKVLIEAQEMKKAFKIMFEKYVDVDFLKSADNVKEYNKLIKFKVFLPLELTEEEFNLVKRYANEG